MTVFGPEHPVYSKNNPIPREKYSPVQQRCGICDLLIESGQSWTRVDDERVHRACAMGDTAAELFPDRDTADFLARQERLDRFSDEGVYEC